MLKDIETLIAPAVKLTELNKATAEKFIAAQQAAVKEAVALTESRIAAAMQVKDIDGLTVYLNDQYALLKSGSEKLVADSQAFAEDLKAYGEEVLQLLQPEAAAAPAKPGKVAKRAIKAVEPVVETDAETA